MYIAGTSFDVHDIPKHGYYIDKNIQYDLRSFIKFYKENHKRFKAKQVKDGNSYYNIADMSEIMINNKSAILYSEAGSELSVEVFENNVWRVYVGKNIDNNRKGTIYVFNEGFKTTYFKPENSYSVATIHTHPDFGLELKFKLHRVFNMTGKVYKGPSDSDLTPLDYPVKSVVIDNRYIYLINSKFKETVIFRIN